MPSPDLKNQLEAKIKENPQSLVFAHLADIYLDNDQIDDAIQLCQQGLKSNPTYITGHYILAKAYLKNNEFEKAESALKKVLSHDRHFLSAHKHLGDLMVKLGWENTAITHYRDILKMDPFETTVRDLLANFSEEIAEAVELPASDLMEETDFSSESLPRSKKEPNDEWVSQIREVFPEELSENTENPTDSGEPEYPIETEEPENSDSSLSEIDTDETVLIEDNLESDHSESEFSELESIDEDDVSDIVSNAPSEPTPPAAGLDEDKTDNSGFTEFDLDRLVPASDEEGDELIDSFESHSPSPTLPVVNEDIPEIEIPDESNDDLSVETFGAVDVPDTNEAGVTEGDSTDRIEDFVLPDFSMDEPESKDEDSRVEPEEQTPDPALTEFTEDFDLENYNESAPDHEPLEKPALDAETEVNAPGTSASDSIGNIPETDLMPDFEFIEDDAASPDNLAQAPESIQIIPEAPDDDTHDTSSETEQSEHEEILELPEDVVLEEIAEESLDLQIEIIEENNDPLPADQSIEASETIELPVIEPKTPIKTADVNKSEPKKTAVTNDSQDTETSTAADNSPSDSSETKPRILTPTLGEIYIAQEQFDKALIIFKELLEQNPENQGYKDKIIFLNEKIKDMKL